MLIKAKDIKPNVHYLEIPGLGISMQVIDKVVSNDNITFIVKGSNPVSCGPEDNLNVADF
jgi:hypothetical protein